MAHRTAGVEPYQRTELEIDVIANISPILVFRYFSSRHSCSGTRAPRVCVRPFVKLQKLITPPHQPHPRILAVGDECYLVLTYRVYWAHSRCSITLADVE